LDPPHAIQLAEARAARLVREAGPFFDVITRAARGVERPVHDALKARDLRGFLVSHSGTISFSFAADRERRSQRTWS
jgi:hypothetical protein